MPLSPGRKALILYSLIRAKVYIQNTIQRRHYWDAWCLESQYPALRCWAPTTRHCAGGGYRESHPPCALLRLTLSREPLRLANRETLRTGTDFNSVLNGPCVALRGTRGRCLPLFKPKSQSVGKQPELQHRAKVSSHALQKWPQDSLQWPGRHLQLHGKWLTATHLGPSKLGEMGSALPYFFGKPPNQPVRGTCPPACSDTLCDRRTDALGQRESMWQFIHYV